MEPKNQSNIESKTLRLSKAWQLGLLIVIGFSVTGEFLVVFDEYVFYRLGIDRDLMFLFLWLAPAVSAYIATYYSNSYKLLSGLSFIIVFPAVGAFAHFINGELGGAVDFTGLNGAFALFKIYFSIGSILTVAGTLIGFVFSKNGENQK